MSSGSVGSSARRSRRIATVSAPRNDGMPPPGAVNSNRTLRRLVSAQPSRDGDPPAPVRFGGLTKRVVEAPAACGSPAARRASLVVEGSFAPGFLAGGRLTTFAVLPAGAVL